MLIKEYHIPLPLTLEEYRIAQLYMIQVGTAAFFVLTALLNMGLVRRCVYSTMCMCSVCML